MVVMARKIRPMLFLALCAALLIIAGCGGPAIEANQRQVQANQEQIEAMQKQLAELQSQQNYGANTPAPGTPGSCDHNVMDKATKSGGDAFAAGDLNKALGYYQDALTACPGNAKAEVNVARTYEGLGDRAAAIEHYRKAASSGSSDSETVSNAKTALTRLGVSFY